MVATGRLVGSYKILSVRTQFKHINVARTQFNITEINLVFVDTKKKFESSNSISI